MAQGDGDGWVYCRCGARHWGLFGAAGLVLVDRHHRTVLLQLRAAWTHNGGTWAVPGGARDSHEDLTRSAVREAGEETGISPGDVEVLDRMIGIDHVDWSYWYIVARPSNPWDGLDVSAPHDPGQAASRRETEDLRWVPLDQVDSLPLLEGFRATWPRLQARLLDTISRA